MLMVMGSGVRTNDQDKESAMTETWADYLISAVRYNAAETHIEKVQVREDEGEKVGSPSTWERSKVVSNLEGGNTFVTITESSDGTWQRGAEVRIVTVREVKYIRTNADATEEDNLEDLPRF
jgi:hypothetical protein